MAHFGEVPNSGRDQTFEQGNPAPSTSETDMDLDTNVDGITDRRFLWHLSCRGSVGE